MCGGLPATAAAPPGVATGRTRGARARAFGLDGFAPDLGLDASAYVNADLRAALAASEGEGGGEGGGEGDGNGGGADPEAEHAVCKPFSRK